MANETSAEHKGINNFYRWSYDNNTASSFADAYRDSKRESNNLEGISEIEYYPGPRWE